jgi:hypothetical protein
MIAGGTIVSLRRINPIVLFEVYFNLYNRIAFIPTENRF